MPLPKQNKHYTYADYCTWDDSERWELIEGIPYAMSPAPAPKHQRISGQLFRKIGNFLDGKPCEVFHAPFDVRLNADDEDDTVVQPDLVIEILSPSTARHDRWVKYNLYRDVGVREYWIVDPDTKTVSVNVLNDEEYIARAYGDADTAPVTVLRGCEINLLDVFTE